MWWLRFFNAFVTQWFRSWVYPRSHYLDSVETRFRVWPTDLDVNFHMNNGMYLSVMDFGRYDMSFRSGFMQTLFENGWYPVVGSQTIRYRRALKLFQKFSIRTQVLGWDERFCYIQQMFVTRRNEVAALAVVKARFVSKKDGKAVDPITVIRAHDAAAVSPVLPPWVMQWADSEDQAWKQGVARFSS